MVSPNVSKGIGEQKITKGHWMMETNLQGMWYHHIKAPEPPVRSCPLGT